MGDYKWQITETGRYLVDPYHPFGTVKIHLPECIPYQQAGFFLFFRSNGILKVKYYPVRLMQAGIDHHLWGIAGEIEPGIAPGLPVAMVQRLRFPGKQEFFL